MTNEQDKHIIEQQQIIIEKLSKSKEKDGWDKLATLSTFLSSIVIGVIGVYFANAYKAQEVRVGEIQVVEKFIPILAGTDENTKKGALLTIASLNNQDLAVRLGTSYASPGTIEAMEILLKTSKGENENLLRDALVDAYYNRADSRNNSNYDQVVDDINRVLSLKPISELKKRYDGYFLANCYQVLGYAYYKIFKYDDAYNNFQKSLEIVPNFNRANWGLGVLFWDRDDQDRSLEKALSYFDQALAFTPFSNTYFLDRGQLHRQMGHAPEALTDFDDYISLSPNDPQGYIEKAKIYLEKGDYANAKNNLEVAHGYAKDPVQQANIDRLIREVNSKTRKSRQRN
jgi:tetratricopeptide (TPR) repeat protein